MQGTPNITFETLENQYGFTLTTISNNFVNVICSDAPEDYILGQTSEAIIFMMSSDVRATAFTSEDAVVLLLTTDSNIPQSFSISFENIVSSDIKKNQIILHLSNTKIFVDITDCTILNSDSHSLTILMTGEEATIEFYTQVKSVSASSATLRNVSMFSVDDGKMLIPPSKRMPEFIISIYDDEDCKRPRPLRLGVPVISTLPGFIPDDSWNITVPQVDKDLMNIGVGASSRKMYFKVISDQNIDGSLRDKVKLEINLPAGVDTVARDVSIPLTYNSSSDANDIFDGSYDFKKEDTVDYVDGFAYLSVRLPLRIQRNLPLTFQISTDGISFDYSTGPLPDVISVDALSVDKKAVQTKIVKSNQGMTGLKKKNNKNVNKPTK